MSECNLDTSVADWVIEYPATLTVFQELDIDYGCGGKSLAYACHQRGLHAQAVLMKLLVFLDSMRQGSACETEVNRNRPGRNDHDLRRNSPPD
jgi:iron-sulfur cluster repair protein YtfE (RIC family)